MENLNLELTISQTFELFLSQLIVDRESIEDIEEYIEASNEIEKIERFLRSDDIVEFRF